MNYSSLAILSRCPQAPVPNLGQYNHQPVSAPSEGHNDPSRLPVVDDRQHHCGDLVVSAAGSAAVHSNVSVQHSTYPPTNVPAAFTKHQPSSGEYVSASGITSATGLVSTTSSNVTEPSLSITRVGVDDDDFDDFKTAPVSMSPGNVPLDHGLSIVHSRNSG